MQFERSSTKLMLSAAVLGLFFVLGIFVAVIVQSPTPSYWIWLIPVFFGGLFLLSLWNIWRLPKIVYEVTHDGITLFNLSDQQVSWRNVKSVTILSAKGSQLIVLNFVTGFKFGRSGKSTKKALTVTSNIVRAKFADLYQAINQAHANFHANPN